MGQFFFVLLHFIEKKNYEKYYHLCQTALYYLKLVYNIKEKTNLINNS